MFLLPKNVPHSPQRQANTVGLVVERQRQPGELDGFEWYCEKCSALIYQERLQLQNIVTDMPPVFARYESTEHNRTCKSCGWVMPLREKPNPQ